MKTRFTTVDIIAIINELKQYIGYRVVKVYDIDSKTFLFKLSKTGEEGKTTLLIESGTRIHTTDFDWPKNPTPSGMSMKLRKHIKNRRLTAITQIGSDRIIDLQFGSNECACHFIAELYDRGNLILTDFEYTILHCGRTRVDNVEHKLIAKEKYSIEDAIITDYVSDEVKYKEQLAAAIAEAKPSDNIRKIASSLFVYGPNLLEHCIYKFDYTLNTKLSHALKTASESEIINRLYTAMVDAQKFIADFHLMEPKGFIYGRSKEGEDLKEVTIYEDFHPIQFNQLSQKSFKEVASFNEAVDLFFSSIGTQKTEQQISQKEKAALKKLENIKHDHEKRLKELQDTQEIDKIKGEMIELNLDLVNRIILTLNHAIANQVLWDDIQEMVKEGQKDSDSLVSCIVSLNLECNKVTLRLKNPYYYNNNEDDDEDEDNKAFVDTDIDLSMNAHSNARRYFTMKKAASSKEQKTLSSSTKAMKSAEIKTKQMLTEVQLVAKINKARKTNWFEKFNWFISSENYLVVGGKDQCQNELLVKRYMCAGDVYVHADMHGASTVIVKNHRQKQQEVPPKTLNEAGNMAVVYSGAWASKVASAAWWVYHDQVTKTAPSGEYLSTGSFMIRGKKNYLPLLPLTFGFGIIFKLSDESLQNHIDERKIKCDVDEVIVEEGECKVEEFEEVLSEEEEESEFPNIVIKTDVLVEKEEEEKVVIGGDVNIDHRHKYVSVKERRVQKKVGGVRWCIDTDKEDEEIKEKKEIEKNKEIIENKKIKEIEEILENKEIEENKEIVENKENKKIKEMEQAKENKEPKKIEKINREEAIEDVVNEGSDRMEKKNDGGPLKRRQKNKLKKIKEKYGDQDEEERELKMAILQGKNPFKNDEENSLKPLTKKEKRKRDEEIKKIEAENKLNKRVVVVKRQEKKEGGGVEKKKEVEGEEGEEEEVGDAWQSSSACQGVLNSLTGQPSSEDELLYALGVCAPYQTLQNYKFKVKMLPGTTKRGKAGKTLLFNFTNVDKSVSPREKELLKALKDQDITRNFPGTVKIYTPRITSSNNNNKNRKL